MEDETNKIRKKILKGLRELATTILAFSCLVGIWYIVYYLEVMSHSLFPPPHLVVQKAVFLFTKGGLIFDMMSSVQRVGIGVTIGVAAAIPVGFILGWNEKIGSFFEPLINFFRALPPIALIPLVIVYFGIGEFAKTVVLFYASFFAAVVVMYEGISAIDPLYIRAAKSLGASGFEIFYRVVVPLSVPHILTALRTSLGVSWATLVAAELIAAQVGLGAVIQNASNYFQIATIYMGIIIIGLLALVMDRIIRLLSGYFTRWQEEFTT